MKILVSIKVPAITERYDMMLPASMRIKSLIPLICETVEELSNNMYVASGRECLCSIEKNIQFRPNASLEQYGIQSGDHLILI